VIARAVRRKITRDFTNGLPSGSRTPSWCVRGWRDRQLPDGTGSLGRYTPSSPV